MGKQIWRPDTCGCVIEEDITDGVLKMSRFVEKCEWHSKLDDQAAWDAVYGSDDSEQKRKNTLLNYLVTSDIAGLTETDAQGSEKAMKKGVDLKWSWSESEGDKAITVWLDGFALTEKQRDDAQAWCDDKFGPGKVTVT